MASMGIFERLQQQRRFERRHLPFLLTYEDFDLVVTIGQYQNQGRPVTMKQICGMGLGSLATLQRRLARLKRLGMVVANPVERDRRNVALQLSSRIQRIFQRYESMLAAGEGAVGDGAPAE